MILFNNKKKETKKARSQKVSSKKGASQKADISASGSILLRPRITEKAAHLSAQNVYTFEIMQNATKGDVVKAIKSIYRITPKKVHIVKNQGKRVRLRTRRGLGTRAGIKKVYVYLKEGDRIEFAS